VILFIALGNWNYVPTSKAFFQELNQREENEVQIIDPGVNNILELKKKINASDLIILDISFIIAMGLRSLNTIDFYIVHQKPKEFYLEVWDTIHSSSKPLFLFSPSSDLNAVNFGMERNLYLSLLRRCDGIFWPYFRCPVQAGTIPERYNSILPSLNIKDTDLIGIWNEITSTIKINIDLPHCIASAEMISKSKKKKWNIIVPGAGYNTRKIALNTALANNLKVTPFNLYRKWLVTAPYYLHKIFLPKARRISLQQKNSFTVYRYLISHSAVTFTCGSELKYFVRKFIEVPAFRSAMIAYPSDNFRDYGFEDGVHYMYCLPEETAEKTKFLLVNKMFSEKMIEKAWDLVAVEHSAKVRVDQVLACLDAFKQGKLKGAGYFEGRFEIF
jgi:hypothetical protein